MFLLLFGLILVFMRPAWGFLFFFAGCVAVLQAFFALLSTPPEMQGEPREVVLIVQAVAIAINVGLFLAIGAVIVVLRRNKRTGKSSNDRQLDEDMARIRAEIAARNSQPPVT